MGGIVASVSGSLAASHLDDWRSGRTIRASVLLREPTVYRNPGVRDERVALARRGIHLFATIKSGALIEVVQGGGWWRERAADIRRLTRRAIASAVGRWSEQSAAIVIAILIGDRAGLDPEVERRLQEAGTYHVIAISGGNVAILAGFLLGVLRLAGVRRQSAAWLAIIVLVAYADLVGGGASVNRATLMAITFMVALACDVRGVSLNALLAAAAMLLCVSPLSLYDIAFALTCGATLGILVAGTRLSSRLARTRWLSAPASLLAASLSAELALLPVAAWAFSRVTFAGLLLNFLAIPLMAVAQLAGMLAVPLALVQSSLACVAGLAAHVGAAGLVRTAAFVDVAPVLTWRVPPPPAAIVAAYYVAWLLLLVPLARLAGLKPRPTTREKDLAGRGFSRGNAIRDLVGRGFSPGNAIRELAGWGFSPGVLVRGTGVCLLVVSSIWILWSPVARWRGAQPTGLLRATALDVGQADSLLVRFPDGRAWLVDTGGSRAGGTFDIGGRVIEPVLWHYDIFRLHRLVITHGDPDHLGGAPALLRDFHTGELWEGIDVPRDAAVQRVRAQAAARGVTTRFVRAGEQEDVGGVRVSVWHPPPPDWERQKVRNDDSVVMELRFNDVSLLLTGDIGKDVERAISPRLSLAPLVVLKVPHHGSAGSSSPALLAAAHPAVAIFTVGNVPPPAGLSSVLARYSALGATVVQTGADGAVEVETDGREVRVVTFTGRREVFTKAKG